MFFVIAHDSSVQCFRGAAVPEVIADSDDEGVAPAPVRVPLDQQETQKYDVDTQVLMEPLLAEEVIAMNSKTESPPKPRELFRGQAVEASEASTPPSEPMVKAQAHKFMELSPPGTVP